MSEEDRTEQALAGLTSYSVKFVCGFQDSDKLEVGMVRPGVYATEINIHNYHDDTRVEVRKQVLPLVMEGRARGREPEFVGVTAQDSIVLPPNTATMDDSFRIAELVYGTPLQPLPLTIGYLEIVSTRPLAVDAVYTASDREGRTVAVDVQRIEGQQK